MTSQGSSKARAVALLFCALLPACGRAGASAVPAPRPIPVKVQTLAPNEQLALARYSGSIEPALQVDMAFRVSGYVEALGQVRLAGGGTRALDKGDFVKKGTVLARIRQADFEHKVATARAATLEAHSQEKLARLELERSQRLLDSATITRAEYDAKLANSEYAVANTGGAEARLAEAQISLHDTVLRAPMDGVILARDVEVGALIAPGQHAFTVADTASVKVVFGVPQDVVAALALESPIQVFVDAEAGAPERPVDAQVTRIAPNADALGRVFSVEAQLDNQKLGLRPGSVVAVHVPGVTQKSAALAIPLASVIRSPGRPDAFSVFVLAGKGHQGTARLRDVELGDVLGNSVTVQWGLLPGERVVTVGSTLLRDGATAVVIR